MVFDIIQQYFIDPITQYSGYNPVNTIVYAAILIAVAFFIIFPKLDKRGIKFNIKFMLALLPYILVGISFRILEDLHLLPRSPFPWEIWYYTISPGIWILIGVLTVACLLIARKIAAAKNQDFLKIFGGIGFVLWLPLLALNLMHFTEWGGFAAIAIFTLLLTGIVVFITNRIKPSIFADKLGIFALGGQALDGTATVVATAYYNCGEQHFTSGFLLGLHPLLFPLAKVALVLLLLHYINKEIESPNMRGFAKIFVAIAGFAPGLRDIFTVAVGTCL
ncbi:MAG: DUF63 family protein [Candidatus Diapherotrites archaeon]|nr:DUF63 family protein [Candidatus Micrarchaeota archaeon]